MRNYNPFNRISEEIKKVEASFGGKSYSSEQLSIIHSHGEKVPIEVFQQACRDLIGKSRYKPLPIDFQKALLPYHERKNSGRIESEYKVQCAACQDTGLCFIRAEFDILVKCHCEKGGLRTEVFPRLDRCDARDPFPVELFKPDLDPKTGEANIAAKVSWWRDMLEISKSYWESRAKGESR